MFDGGLRQHRRRRLPWGAQQHIRVPAAAAGRHLQHGGVEREPARGIQLKRQRAVGGVGKRQYQLRDAADSHGCVLPGPLAGAPRCLQCAATIRCAKDAAGGRCLAGVYRVRGVGSVRLV